MHLYLSLVIYDDYWYNFEKELGSENMAKRRKSVIPGMSFSWKRAVGISSAKQKFARKTGIPTTRSGMQRKAGRMMGCLIPLSILCITIRQIYMHSLPIVSNCRLYQRMGPFPQSYPIADTKHRSEHERCFVDI